MVDPKGAFVNLVLICIVKGEISPGEMVLEGSRSTATSLRMRTLNSSTLDLEFSPWLTRNFSLRNSFRVFGLRLLAF